MFEVFGKISVVDEPIQKVAKRTKLKHFYHGTCDQAFNQDQIGLCIFTASDIIYLIFKIFI